MPGKVKIVNEGSTEPCAATEPHAAHDYNYNSFSKLPAMIVTCPGVPDNMAVCEDRYPHEFHVWRMPVPGLEDRKVSEPVRCPGVKPMEPEEHLDKAERALIDARTEQSEVRQLTLMGAAGMHANMATAKFLAQFPICDHGNRGFCHFCSVRTTT